MGVERARKTYKVKKWTIELEQHSLRCLIILYLMKQNGIIQEQMQENIAEM